MTTNTQTGTRIDEIADGIYRISTPVPPEAVPGGFSFNQFLVVDDAPLLYHTGLAKLFPLVSEAIASVIPVSSLRYLAFSHYEADECGALNEFLKAAPQAEAVCSQVAKMVSVDDVAIRPAHALGDGEELSLGKHVLRWIDAPHFPHAWECGHAYDKTTGTLFCGDLFTQGGAEHDPVTTDDIVETSEGMRAAMDYYSHTATAAAMTEKLAALSPKLLACMHGASWEGDGAAMLRRLGKRLAG